MNKFEDKNWKDFYLSEFFCCEKGNQNNMASLQTGDIPLVSAKKCDNGYKDFVAPNGKKQFQGDIITLNNDGDGGAGIAYYQPYQMALDSHVTALIPLVPMNRHILLFVAMCITKQRDAVRAWIFIEQQQVKVVQTNVAIKPRWYSTGLGFYGSLHEAKRTADIETYNRKIMQTTDNQQYAWG